MADKAEFLQAINEAILDADSLERFINGNDTQDVLTRLSKRYPTLQKAIKQMFENGGLPATPFKTKALMTASALVDGKYAMVTDDTVNNGLYVKTAGTWVRSAYDIEDTVTKKVNADISDKIVHNNFKQAVILIDANGHLLADIDNEGGLHLNQLDGSVQNNLKDARKTTEIVGSSLAVTSPKDILYHFQDIDGNTVARVMRDGGLYIHGIEDSVQNQLKKIASAPPKEDADGVPSIHGDGLRKYAKATHYPTMSDNYSALITKAKTVYTHTAPVANHMTRSDYRTSDSWINSVTMADMNPDDFVPIDGYDPTFRKDIGVVHPQTWSFREKVAGYQFWMCITPYTNSNEDIEIPFIYGTNNPDFKDWQLIEGFPAPFEYDPITKLNSYRGHLSDACMTHDPFTGDLILVWRESLFFMDGASDVYGSGMHDAFRACRYDGVGWSENYYLYEPESTAINDLMLSPSILFNEADNLFYLYYSTGSGYLMYKTAPHLNGGDWSESTRCVLTGQASNFKVWHSELKLVGNKLVALFQDEQSKNSKLSKDTLNFGVSSDFNNFIVGSDITTSGTPSLYKASFEPIFLEGNQAQFIITYTTDQFVSPKFQLHTTKTNIITLGE